MKIAIVSDSHDHIENNTAVIAQITEMGVDALIHCGDHCGPFIFSAYADLDIPQHHVMGNNLGDPFITRMICADNDHMQFHRIYAELDFDGMKFAVIHYPEPALRIAQSGHFDVVCYGTYDVQYRPSYSNVLPC
jgi:predicted phosphodiesterase